MQAGKDGLAAGLQALEAGEGNETLHRSDEAIVAPRAGGGGGGGGEREGLCNQNRPLRQAESWRLGVSCILFGAL